MSKTKNIHRIKISRENQWIFALNFYSWSVLNILEALAQGVELKIVGGWENTVLVLFLLFSMYLHMSNCIRLGAELREPVLWPSTSVPASL